MNENERDLIPTKLIGVMSTYLPKIYTGTNIKSYTMLCGYDIEFGRYESKEDMILKVLKSFNEKDKKPLQKLAEFINPLFKGDFDFKHSHQVINNIKNTILTSLTNCNLEYTDINGKVSIVNTSINQINKINIKENSDNNFNILTFEYINEHIESAKKFFSEKNYKDSITHIRTLLENIFKFILSNENIEYTETESGDLKKLFRKLKEILNFNAEKIKNAKIEKDLVDAFVSLSGSLENIVGNIATISNKMSSRHACEGEPLKHHCLLCINTGFALSQFILDIYNNKKIKTTNKLKGGL